MDGIERELDPGDPHVGRNMYEIPLSEARAEGLEFAPSSLEGPRRVRGRRGGRGALGPELAAEFLRVKRQEWVRYHNSVGQWEVDQYLTLF